MSLFKDILVVVFNGIMRAFDNFFLAISVFSKWIPSLLTTA